MTVSKDKMEETTKTDRVRSAIDVSIKVGLLVAILFWTFEIIRPFYSIFFWSVVISVTLYPVYTRLVKLLKGRKKLSAAIVTLALIAIMAVPVEIFVSSLIEGVQKYSKDLTAEDIKVPTPDPSVANWPIIGEFVYDTWKNLSEDTFKTVEGYAPQLKAAGLWILNTLMGFGMALIQFIAAIIISGFLLANAEASGNIARKFFIRVMGEEFGSQMAKISEVTIRNVSNGVLGVAIAQSFLAGMIFLIAGVPFAGLWTLLCFVLAAVQIGPGPVIFGVIFYLFVTASTSTAILWTIPLVLITFVDNVLRPWLMGQGSKVPMLIIFIGSIGGLMLSGFLGMFTGAILLAIVYQLFLTWLNDTNFKNKEEQVVKSEEN